MKAFDFNSHFASSDNWNPRQTIMLLHFISCCRSDTSTPSFTLTQTINFSPKCIKFCTQNFSGTNQRRMLPSRIIDYVDDSILCVNEKLSANVELFTSSNMEMHFCRKISFLPLSLSRLSPVIKVDETKKNVHKHFDFFISSLFFSCVKPLFFHYILIKKQFSLSIFRLHFIAFVLHCRSFSFLLRFFSLGAFPLFVFDYLLNDIMTSNLVINQNFYSIICGCAKCQRDRYVFPTKKRRDMHEAENIHHRWRCYDIDNKKMCVNFT